MARPHLLAINPVDRRTRQFTLPRAEVTVGSEKGNAFRLPDKSVSRRHAIIRYHSRRYEVRDLKSTNGTFINGRRIHEPAMLRDGDHLRFGTIDFVFADPKAPATAGRSRRHPVVTALELLLVFAVGFGVTEYLINRTLLDRKVGDVFRPARREAARSSGIVASPGRPSIAPATAAPSAAASAALAESVVPTAPSVKSPVRSGWLGRINYYRAIAKLPAVHEDAALSDGDFKHARYLVENYREILIAGGDPGGAAHLENPSRQWYSPEGFAAAQNSNVYEGCSPSTPEQQVDGWMSGPFHRTAILNPALSAVGYGRYEKEGCWVSALDLHLASASAHRSPVEFPGNGETTPLRSFDGQEWPQPLASCPGYVAPTGLPITLQLEPGTNIALGAHSVARAGKPIEHCAFDASTYTNPNGFTEQSARRALEGKGAIVVIPLEPLIAGSTYTVSIIANDRTYVWSFNVALHPLDAEVVRPGSSP